MKEQSQKIKEITEQLVSACFPQLDLTRLSFKANLKINHPNKELHGITIQFFSKIESPLISNFKPHIIDFQIATSDLQTASISFIQQPFSLKNKQLKDFLSESLRIQQSFNSVDILLFESLEDELSIYVKQINEDIHRLEILKESMC